MSVAIAAATVLIGASAVVFAVRERAVAAGAPVVAVEGDTTTIFIETFHTLSGAETQYVETFTTTVVPGRRYFVEVVKGTPSLTKADVVFNRLKVATVADLGPSEPFRRIVAALPSDTFDIRVAGSPEANIRVSLKSVPDPTYTIRGPIVYNKSNQFVPDTFAVAAPPASAPYYAYVTNGPPGKNRANSLQLRLNGVDLTVPPEFGTNLPGFVIPLSLVNGQNVLAAKVGGPNGAAVDIRTVATDVIPPALTINNPAPGLITKQLEIGYFGTAKDSTLALVTANGNVADFGPQGVFDGEIALPQEGNNIITFRATDRAGLFTEVMRTIIRDTQSPVLNVLFPPDGHITSEATLAVSGTVSDLTTVTVNVNGTPLPVQNGSFSGNVALSMGLNVLSFTATDAVNNATTVVRQVTRSDAQLPPDPSTVAPALDRTVATNMFDATSFLYTGTNPIQTGVAAGAISPARVTVIRGKVKSRLDTPISGVEISILGHPEYGKTFTRADGAFDIAVNGGAQVTVDYRKAGLLPAQRSMSARLQDYESVDDVVMIALDTAMTSVNFTAPITVHRGSTVTDADGTRRPTVMFQQGTQATMVMPDSSTQLLSSITVRATEYSIGESGPLAMPAELPGTVGYTFTLELSADEAVAAGASSVEFSKPVPVYVENFLGFPVGLSIPTAFYDRGKGSWVPTLNGRIIKVVGVSGGLATISVDTLGTVADSATLSGLGITDAERQTLASLYSVGQELWRVQVTHFSATGIYCPAGPTPGAVNPNVTQKKTEDPNPPCETAGSIIECETQVLGEELDVTGAPFRFAYRSVRTRGFSTAYRREITVIGDTVPPQLLRAQVELEVAGRRFTQTVQPQPNQRFTFSWDGLDAYGRRVQGRKPLTIRIDYVYRLLYLVPAPEAASFGLLCYGSGGSFGQFSACVVDSVNCACTGGRSEVKLSRTYQMWIGEHDIEGDLTGSWSPDIHHRFDPVSRILYLGDGRRRLPEDIIETVAGTGVQGTAGDGGPAVQAQLIDPMGVAVGNDGSVYISDRSFRIRRVDPNGIITTIAGNGQFGVSGDSGPALQASISNGPLAVGPDGSIYLGQWSFGTIRRIWPDGTITRAAGDPSIAFCVPDEEPDSLAVRTACLSDGIPAVDASIWGPFGLAVGPDGSIYFSDGNWAIRKVSANGIITTLAGGGWAGSFCNYGNPFPWPDSSCGDGGPARLAGLEFSTSVALGPDGSVYFWDTGNGAARRIWPNGMITRVAGTGTGSGGFSGDGGPATSALVGGENGLAIGVDASFYLGTGDRIRRVAPNGIITTIAGGGSMAFQCGVPNPPTCLNYEPATQATFIQERFSNVAAAPDGSIYFVTHFGDHRVRRIVPFFRMYDSTGIAIASEDGVEVYEFDANGRHLRTRDALTSHVLFSFGYDSAGRLTSVTDADGNVTTLQRNASGELTAFISPFGQQTTVTLDGRGYLATLTNPAGEVITAVHDTLGLLRSLRDAKNNPPQRFGYDSLGLLVADTASSGFFQTLARTETDTSVSVTLTSAMNRTESFQRVRQPTGNVLHLQTDPAGLTTQRQAATNGTTVTTTPDGTVSTMTERADPRFGMQAPFLGSFSVALPSGLTLAGASKRNITLSDPLNPLSLTSQTDSLTVNGRTFASVWNAAARTVTATSAVGRQTVSVLDSTGRVVEERVTGVAPVKYHYSPRGFLTSVTQAGRVLQYDYDSTGRVKQVTDPFGRTEQFLYDSVGRVKTQTLPDGRIISYAYDANGNLTALTPPTKPAHTFSYTTGNLDSIYAPPPAGLSSFQTRYSYNLDQQLTQILRPDSQAIVIGYDAAGRPSGLTLPGESTTVSYHPTTGLLSSLTSVTGGALGFTYDGALPKIATWTGSVAGSVEYGYDANFRVVALKVNGADSIALGYDNDNLLTMAGSLTLARDPQNGRLTGTTQGSLTTTHTYDDSVGTLKRSTAAYSSSTLLDFQYTRDTLDRITQLIETVQGSTQTWAYAYDSVGRLDQVRLNGVLVSDYAYDGNGNRIGLTTQSGSVTGTVDDQDRLLTYGTNSYTYTSHGELTRKVNGPDTTRYTYDVLGNLRQVTLPNGTVIDYLVDGQNRRIGRKVDGVLTQGFLYQGQLAPIAELDASNQIVSRFVYGTHVNVPEYLIKGGVTYRLLTDHLGSVRLVVKTSDGSVVQRLDYDEFGRVTQNTNPGFQPFGFAGGVYDDATKLVRFGARDYDAETGRWTAKDPLGLTSAESSRFAYAMNDPLNYVDPTGLRVSVCFHRYIKGFYHTYVWIEPQNGSPAFSLGAGRVSFSDPRLESNRGRTNDMNPTIREGCVEVILPCPEEDFIRSLLELDANYGDHLPYSAFPHEMPFPHPVIGLLEQGYNSNSYTAGLLRAAGATPPAIPVFAPGYGTPVPTRYFRP